MSNVALNFLIGLAIIITIGVITALIIFGVNYYNETKNSGKTGTAATQPCIKTVDIDSLIQIPDNNHNCVQNGVTGSLYYIGKLDKGQYDYVVAPWGTSPLDVCIGFCTGYTGGVCKGPNYNGVSAQDNFNNCMSQLSSTSCIPPKPIAARGAILYYAFSPTCNICENCG